MRHATRFSVDEITPSRGLPESTRLILPRSSDRDRISPNQFVCGNPKSKGSNDDRRVAQIRFGWAAGLLLNREKRKRRLRRDGYSRGHSTIRQSPMQGTTDRADVEEQFASYEAKDRSQLRNPRHRLKPNLFKPKSL